MKNINTVLNIILLAAVAVLFFLFFKNKTNNISAKYGSSKDMGKMTNGCSIAYFEMDTVEQHYNYIKDVREQLKEKEQGISNDLNEMKKGFLNRIQAMKAKEKFMSQQEGDEAQAQINGMQQEMQQAEARMSQQLQEMQFKLMQDVQKKIEDFLKIYNEEKKFTYILSHQAGDIMYFKDSANNITNDVISGLNNSYKKKD